ncbi:hypothetical protein MJT46_019658, partial [Ovis ammon polii x Ovis aries]
FYFLVKAPFLVDLKKPELKIPHTVNFYIKVEPGVILGIWHTVPSCRGEDAKGKGRSWYEAALCDGNPIIVYLHGSAQHRSVPLLGFFFPLKQSKRPFYSCRGMKGRAVFNSVSILPHICFHLLEVKGFGDSTGTPTEDGLTADAVYVYEWTKARSGTTPVCLWGHSLGTGSFFFIIFQGFPADAIILEAPFTNIWVASINYPLLKVSLIHLYKMSKCRLRNLNVFLELNTFLPLVPSVKFLSSPLLIIHGEDDKTVPLEFGKKLYEIAHNAYRNKERVKMVIFPPGFGHNSLCKSSALLHTVR